VEIGYEMEMGREMEILREIEMREDPDKEDKIDISQTNECTYFPILCKHAVLIRGVGRICSAHVENVQTRGRVETEQKRY